MLLSLTEPRERLLGEYLDRIACPQIVLIAACYSGRFLLLARDGRLALAACGADESYHVESAPARSAFLCEFLSHWAGVVLPSFPSPPATLSPHEAFDAAKEKLVKEYQTKVPLREGTVSWPRGL